MHRILSSSARVGNAASRWLTFTDMPAAEIDAFRPAGGAAGVLQGRKIIGTRPGLRQLPIGFVPPGIEAAAGLAADPHRVAYADCREQRLDFAGGIGVVDNRDRIGVVENVA